MKLPAAGLLEACDEPPHDSGELGVTAVVAYATHSQVRSRSVRASPWSLAARL